jgi:hypothetical protein
MPDKSTPDRPGPLPLPGWALALSPGQRRGLIGLCVAFALFCGLVEFRSAFLIHRKGDLNVFLRAGWAVRSGADLYDVTDDNGFHYNYPPFLAVLVAPLADPPTGFDRSGMLPWPVSVAVWYALSLLCLAVAVHHLAGALEQTSPDPAVRLQPRGCRRWWALRIVPILACLVPVGHTLMRGQANLLVLALLCGCLAAVLRGRRFLGGLCLAGAVCLKVFPAFLILFPLWRRDGRCLAGCAAGLVLGLAVVPLAALGPVRTWECYEKFLAVTLEPGMGVGSDESRARELTNVTATDSQSLLAVLHNSLNYNPATRPPKASPAVRISTMLAGAALTGLTLLAAGWRRNDEPLAVVLLFASLVVNMLLLSPVCHLHYFCLVVPLAMALLAKRWERQETLALGTALTLALVFNAVANLLPQFPRFQGLRDVGVAMYATLLLWTVGIVLLWRRTRRGAAAYATQTWPAATEAGGSPLAA